MQQNCIVWVKTAIVRAYKAMQPLRTGEEWRDATTRGKPLPIM